MGGGWKGDWMGVGLGGAGLKLISVFSHAHGMKSSHLGSGQALQRFCAVEKSAVYASLPDYSGSDTKTRATSLSILNHYH